MFGATASVEPAVLHGERTVYIWTILTIPCDNCKATLWSYAPRDSAGGCHPGVALAACHGSGLSRCPSLAGMTQQSIPGACGHGLCSLSFIRVVLL